jgi:transcription initiation factor TFIID TATA-box-binding protein
MKHGLPFRPSELIIQHNPKLSIVNLIATADLKQFVDLEQLSHCHGFLHDASTYRGRCAYLKDEKTNGKVTIFSSGKMISVGTKSYAAAKHDLNHAAERLECLGLISKIRIQAKLRNMVATADLGRRIDLEKLSTNFPHVIYEPEQFPAAIYFSPELEGASALIFCNGKLVFAGLKTKQHLARTGNVLTSLFETLSNLD